MPQDFRDSPERCQKRPARNTRGFLGQHCCSGNHLKKQPSRFRFEDLKFMESFDIAVIGAGPGGYDSGLDRRAVCGYTHWRGRRLGRLDSERFPSVSREHSCRRFNWTVLISLRNGGSSQCSSAVEQRFRKPSVAGSIPAIGSISNCWNHNGLGVMESLTDTKTDTKFPTRSLFSVTGVNSPSAR